MITAKAARKFFDRDHTYNQVMSITNLWITNAACIHKKSPPYIISFDFDIPNDTLAKVINEMLFFGWDVVRGDGMRKIIVKERK